MTEAAVTASPETTVGEARRLLATSPTRHLPVLEGGLLAGIVSDHDLEGADPTLPVSHVMTRTVFILPPGTLLRDAARIFNRRRFGALPVLRGRQLVGIVSREEVMRALEDGQERDTGPSGDRE